MFNISKKTDYALLLISYLIGRDNYSPLSKLTQETKLPKRFLAQIGSALAKNMIIQSREGKDGGYKLIKAPNKINLYKFLTIFEGELRFVKCEAGDGQCQWEFFCKHKNTLRNKLNKVVIGELNNWTLADIITKK